MRVVKHSGDVVEFNREKLKKSLLQSGANDHIVEEVLHAIEAEIYEGISTKKIYKSAFAKLKKASNSNAARYNLRTAIQMLGPAGFFFEKYVARLFLSEGFESQTNLFLRGRCVSHEVDVAIKKDGKVAMVECKFHGSKETTSDVKVPMYILSRYNDLKANNHAIFTNDDYISDCWIVTNNRFTKDALSFGNCSGLNLLGWDYPDKNNLRDKINEKHLFPVTCLTTLSAAEKEELMVVDVILVKELIENPMNLQKIGLSQNRIRNVMKEATELCKIIQK